MNRAFFTIHLRSILAFVAAVGGWTWFNTWPKYVFGGGMSESSVAITAEFGYPITVVECYWGEALADYRDPEYRRHARIPPPNAEWSNIRYGALAFDVLVALMICSCVAVSFEFVTRSTQAKNRSAGY